MYGPRLHSVCFFFAAILTAVLGPALSAEELFPFDHELMLDAAPMRGSRQVPIIEIAENGATSI